MAAMRGMSLAMGLMQRQKGKRFEREIAARLRQLWPDAVTRRASQAERADNPDVFVEGGPPLLSMLWLELQDARDPTPTAKLEQAERDVSLWQQHRLAGDSPIREWKRYPVVVWHRLGGRTVYVTTRLWVATTLAMEAPTLIPNLELTMSFDAFITLLCHAISLGMRSAA